MKTLKDYSIIASWLVLIGASFFLGKTIGTTESQTSKPVDIINSESDTEQVDFAPFWKAWDILENRFVPTSTTTKTSLTGKEKLWGAIQGLTEAYDDPYSVFLPPEDSAMFESDISGNFEGVGMEIGIRDGILTVIAPLKGTPAERAGIRTGDQIIEINGKPSAAVSVDEAIKDIRGKKDTPVELLLRREGVNDPVRVNVIRDVINLPTIKTEEIGGGVFVIHLYNFSAISPNLFRNALREYLKSSSDKLILDLRGNPGGYLEASIDMASWFLPAGKIIVREDFGGKEEEMIYRSKGYDIFNDDFKMVILTDGGSASASEILAGALREHGKAKIVGTKTFGKGSVQELIKLTQDTSLKITIARWLTPNGVSISNNGLVPDIEVEITSDDIKNGKDPQMEKAVEVLKGM